MNAHSADFVPDPLELALKYAARGWPVFPCNPLTKRPITENGFHDATTVEATIRRWWRDYPNAMVACPTGPRTGFWALDADIDPVAGKNGVTVLASMGVLPESVEQTTPRGGRHIFFRWDESRPVRNSTSRIGPGVDTRGIGGYVVLAGSVRSDGARYEWSISPENGEIREAPEWLYEAVKKIKPKPETPTDLSGFPLDVEIVTPEAARVLKEQCLIVAGTTTGSRNNALNEAAYVIGLRVGQGEMSKAKAIEALLWAASECGLSSDDGEDSARKTIASGLTAGTADGVKKTAGYWHEELSGDAGDEVSSSDVRSGGSTPAAPWSQPFSDLAGKPVPPQKWLVDGMIPARNVTLLYGDGGTGKSLIALQLAFGAAVTGKWLEMDVAQGPALFVSAEDEPEELHRRIVSIASASSTPLGELSNLHRRSLAGRDAVMAFANSKNLMEETPLFKTLRAEVLRLRPVVLILDTLADLFGGDEVKRVHARQFIQLLQGLVVAADWDLSVVLLAQPSVAGMNSGTGTSGSTAWSNSVRSRLYLERRFAERGDAKVEIDPDIRILSTKKANRAKQGGEVVVRWVAGRFIAQATSAPTRDTISDANDEGVFLMLLDEFSRTQRWVSPNASSPTYAPKMFMSHSTGEEIGRTRLESAMSRLFSQDVIFVQTYGPPSKGYKRIALRTNSLF